MDRFPAHECPEHGPRSPWPPPTGAGGATDGVIQNFPTKNPGRTRLTRVVPYHSNIHRHKVNEGKHGCERTTDDQYATPEHGRHRHRRAFEPNPIHSVVVRQWHRCDDGPGRYPVFLTYAPVRQPRQPCDDDDDRRLIEHDCIRAAMLPWDPGHPPQNTERAVRVHGVCTRLLCALATAYRLLCAPEGRGGEPVGWQRWRRQLLGQTRHHVIVVAQGAYGIVHLAEYSRLLGVKITDVPPDIGSRQQVWAT
jgi:hypothetical protein